MSLILRKADESDVAFILEIVNYEIVNSTVIYDYKPRSYDEQLEWFRKKIEERMPVIVAEKENRVVGFATYGAFRPREAYKYSVEHSVYVSKDARGKGAGMLLMQELIKIAAESGFHTMIAGIDASNLESIGFHEKFGFKEAGKLYEVGYKFGRWLDLVFMQLLLRQGNDRMDE